MSASDRLFDHLQQFGVLSEKMLARIRAALRFVVLVFAVDGFVHALLQQPFVVVGKERIPQASPHDLDDVPARPSKRSFEFLNDLAVAPNRPIQSLQVAIDDEDQIVEMLARSETQHTQRFRFVAFAVT